MLYISYITLLYIAFNSALCYTSKAGNAEIGNKILFYNVDCGFFFYNAETGNKKDYISGCV